MQPDLHGQKWPAALLAVGLVLLAIGMTTHQSTTKNAETGTHTVRVGDLQVTVTAAGTVSSNLARQHQMRARSGYHFVVVNVKLKNVGSYRNCYWPDASLRVDLGFNYETSAYGYTPDFKELDIQDLQPSDESKGSYDFQAKDGTHPVDILGTVFVARDRQGGAYGVF